MRDLLLRTVPDPHEALSKIMDIKYGYFDYRHDLRKKCTNEFSLVVNAVLACAVTGGQNVLFCGTSANELALLGLTRLRKVTAVDISKVALLGIKEVYPQVKVILGSVNKLPFEDATFDVFVSLRAAQSTGVDLDLAVAEIVRVLKPVGMFVLSIPNGYLINGKIAKGMFVSGGSKPNAELPYLLVKEIVSKLKVLGVSATTVEIESEIFIIRA